MTNSGDPDQTAPIGAVSSGSTLFASMHIFVSNVRQLFAADDFSRRHFQMDFLLGALRLKFCRHIKTPSKLRYMYYHPLFKFTFCVSAYMVATRYAPLK